MTMNYCEREQDQLESRRNFIKSEKGMNERQLRGIYKRKLKFGMGEGTESRMNE